MIIAEDACIIIDLININLLDVQLTLEAKFITTDLIINEITSNNQKNTLDNSEFIRQVEIKGFEKEDSINELLNFNAKNNSISLSDNSVLFLAKKRKSILLTNDRRLTKIAKEKYNIETHGIFWLIELLLSKEIINKTEAKNAMELLRKTNNRIKKSLLDDFIKRLAL